MTTNLYDGLSDLKNELDKIMELLKGMREGSSHNRIYDLVDLQNLLNVSRRTIATWTKDGTLPHTKVGNKIWVTEDQLNLFLDEHSSPSVLDLNIRKGGKS